MTYTHTTNKLLTEQAIDNLQSKMEALLESSQTLGNASTPGGWHSGFLAGYESAMKVALEELAHEVERESEAREHARKSAARGQRLVRDANDARHLHVVTDGGEA